uniref:Uncharacterized protein n=1 Tax=Trypanosoma vivax (strain Y486) TaxID=1055687 RepID=G0U1R0_TRYVY|nr:hypothetical protein, unlikely [Trypanosoma vivax Y486]
MPTMHANVLRSPNSQVNASVCRAPSIQGQGTINLVLQLRQCRSQKKKKKKKKKEEREMEVDETGVMTEACENTDIKFSVKEAVMGANITLRLGSSACLR